MIRQVTTKLESLEESKSLSKEPKDRRDFDQGIEEEEVRISELTKLHQSIRELTELNLEPNLSDGVVVNIAMLREVLSWEVCSQAWTDLINGKYDWSSISEQLREKGLVKDQ